MTEQVEDFPRDAAHRFRLYRLCKCPACEGQGKTHDYLGPDPNDMDGEKWGYLRCTLCRGEGRIRDLLAAAEDPEGLGIALVTLGREGEFVDCAVGVLDIMGEVGQKWIVKPWLPSPSPRNVSDAGRVLASARKETT